MAIVFDPPPHTFASIAGGDDVFPVRRIFCVGRNYAAHAREMGRDPDREPPFFFTKWAEAYAPTGNTIAYPPGTENFHYEVELVVAIGEGGRRIREADARKHIFAYAVGLDMTRRDLQLAAREKGRPWDTGKNFEESAPIAPFHLASDVGHVDAGRIVLEVNGEAKQDADIRDLIWSVDEVIEHLSALYELRPGDLIMTGTPAGVGPVRPGDRLVGRIDGLTPVETTIGPEAV